MDGRGFTPLAGQVHAMGLRFGVHLMRGISRLAAERNLPVLDTSVRARDVADTSSTCLWNVDMYGVDMTKPGGQASDDSVFALLAAWGGDFVKVDAFSRPYDSHALEIEAIALTVRRSGRPMILSMSPGETPAVRGAHARMACAYVAYLRRFLGRIAHAGGAIHAPGELEPFHGRRWLAR